MRKKLVICSIINEITFLDFVNAIVVREKGIITTVKSTYSSACDATKRMDKSGRSFSLDSKNKLHRGHLKRELSLDQLFSRPH